MQFKTLCYLVLLGTCMHVAIGIAGDKGPSPTNPFDSDSRSGVNLWEQAKKNGNDENRTHYDIATAIGIGCAVTSHVLNYLKLPQKMKFSSETLCSIAAPIISGLLASQCFETTPLYTLSTAAVSLIACRGAVDLGNQSIKTGKKIKTTVLHLQQLSIAVNAESEQEEE